MSPRFFFKYPHITKKNGQKSPCHPHFGASHIAWDSIYRNFWLALTGGGWVGQEDSVKMTLSVTKFDMWVTPNWMKCVISIFFYYGYVFLCRLFHILINFQALIFNLSSTYHLNFPSNIAISPREMVINCPFTLPLRLAVLHGTLYIKFFDWR